MTSKESCLGSKRKVKGPGNKKMALPLGGSHTNIPTYGLGKNKSSHAARTGEDGEASGEERRERRISSRHTEPISLEPIIS